MNPLLCPAHLPACAATLPVFGTATGLSDALAMVVLPFLFVLCAMAILYLKNYKTRQLQHETIRLMLEKGQPVPPELFLPQSEPPKKRDDRRSGILWLAVAVGIFAFFHLATANSPDLSVGNQFMIHPSYGPTGIFTGILGFGCYRETKWIALIPGTVGAALLLCAWLDRRKEKDDSAKGTEK